MSSRRTTPLLAGLMVLLACDFGDISVADPPPTPSTAQVVLQVRAEEPEATEPFGWTDALLPGATVTLVPEDTTRAERWEGVTGPDGAITFDEVPLGRYVGRVVRALSVEEFEVAEREIGGFAGMLTFSVESARADVEVPAVTSRRRALVISEYYPSNRFESGIGTYHKGDFLELYNNSDTTVYLDHLIIGKGFDLSSNSEPRPCSMFEHLRNDPMAVWARYFHRFPGAGGEYPLPPGGLVVIASQAVDHGVFFDGEPDLRNADFEFAGGPDNPGVPNLPDVGVSPWPGGLDFTGLAGVPFIARSANSDLLPRGREPDSGREYAGFPRDAVVEVASFVVLGHPAIEIPRCPQLVHRAFDRGYAPLSHDDVNPVGNHRRVLLLLPDGRPVLQDTDWSLLDFEWAEWTPGAIPSTPGAL